jgi:hypothetical protein
VAELTTNPAFYIPQLLSWYCASNSSLPVFRQKVLLRFNLFTKGEIVMRTLVLGILVVVVTLFFMGYTYGESLLDKVDIHGFGNWAYGRTDENTYLIGSESGEYDNILFALNISANPFKDLRLDAQMDWNQTDEGTEVELDYAFAEWRFSDTFRFRIGRIKQPFGIYTEIFDVGTLRPFFTLPQGIYGPAGIISESYQGLGFTGSLYGGKGWGIDYDLYGGEVDVEVEEESFEFFASGMEEEETEGIEDIQDTLGARLIISTPLSGLSFGVSGYTGKIEDISGRHSAYGVHGEYLSEAWSVRGEYARHTDEDELRVDAFYVEVAYRFKEHWQAATRYDWSDTELEGVDVSAAPSLLEHKDYAVGVNYWFNPNFVLKFSYHSVDGNRFALPESVDQAILNGTLEERTNLFIFGANFSF